MAFDMPVVDGSVEVFPVVDGSIDGFKLTFPMLATASTLWLPHPVSDPVLDPLVLADDDVYRVLTEACDGNLPPVNHHKALGQLRVLHTAGSGDCLFNAVGLAMWGVQDRPGTGPGALQRHLALLRLATCLTLQECGQAVLRERWLRERLQTPVGSPVALADSWALGEEWVSTLHDAVIPKRSMLPEHIFVLANVLRRPIFVYGPRFIDGIRYPANVLHSGMYLPLCVPSHLCCRDPLVLGYTKGHFSAVVPCAAGSLHPAPALPACVADVVLAAAATDLLEATASASATTSSGAGVGDGAVPGPTGPTSDAGASAQDAALIPPQPQPVMESGSEAPVGSPANRSGAIGSTDMVWLEAVLGAAMDVAEPLRAWRAHKDCNLSRRVGDSDLATLRTMWAQHHPSPSVAPEAQVHQPIVHTPPVAPTEGGCDLVVPVESGGSGPEFEASTDQDHQGHLSVDAPVVLDAPIGPARVPTGTSDAVASAEPTPDSEMKVFAGDDLEAIIVRKNHWGLLDALSGLVDVSANPRLARRSLSQCDEGMGLYADAYRRVVRSQLIVPDRAGVLRFVCTQPQSSLRDVHAVTWKPCWVIVSDTRITARVYYPQHSSIGEEILSLPLADSPLLFPEDPSQWREGVVCSLPLPPASPASAASTASTASAASAACPVEPSTPTGRLYLRALTIPEAEQWRQSLCTRRLLSSVPGEGHPPTSVHVNGPRGADGVTTLLPLQDAYGALLRVRFLGEREVSADGSVQAQLLLRYVDAVVVQGELATPSLGLSSPPLLAAVQRSASCPLVDRYAAQQLAAHLATE